MFNAIYIVSSMQHSKKSLDSSAWDCISLDCSTWDCILACLENDSRLRMYYQSLLNFERSMMMILKPRSVEISQKSWTKRTLAYHVFQSIIYDYQRKNTAWLWHKIDWVFSACSSSVAISWDSIIYNQPWSRFPSLHITNGFRTIAPAKLQENIGGIVFVISWAASALLLLVNYFQLTESSLEEEKTTVNTIDADFENPPIPLYSSKDPAMLIEKKRSLGLLTKQS